MPAAQPVPAAPIRILTPRPAAAWSPDATPAPALPVELAALDGHVHPSVLDWARRRATSLGVGGDEVLICAGQISPEAASRLLAAHLGLPLDPLPPRAPIPPIPPDLLPTVLRLGLLQDADGADATGYTFAARGHEARRLARAAARDPGLSGRARVTSPERLRAHIARHGAGSIGRLAAFGLRDRTPDLSAATVSSASRLLSPFMLIAAALAAATIAAPATTVLAVEAVLSAVFLAAATLKVAACVIPAPRELPLGLKDAQLPVYTLIVPLYREAAVLTRLVAELRALDYPPEKLDIKLVVEPDDGPLLARLKRMRLPPWFHVVVAPPIGPRTKPKALNAALPFARGSFVAVYDAEDSPAPDQLHRALAAFRSGGPRLACVQARLAVDNAQDSWISRHFAAEYAGQFDLMLPALSTLGLPFLLGGTSNHFRRDVLERLGGWDPFNVTEDADLGVRMARAGWRTTVIASTTGEEAPITTPAWMRQRTRWLKGWAQTILVHGRDPRRLVRELGAANACALGLLILAPFASALLHPVCLAVVGYDIVTWQIGSRPDSWVEILACALSYTNLGVGYASAAAASYLGLRHRGLGAIAWVLATLPFYWLLMSLATWRALVQLVRRPHWWDKTQHGLARSRRPVRDIASDRPRPRPAGVSY